MAPSGLNGHATNGHSVNGSTNGYTNGHSVNGSSTNGHATNGHSTNGHSTNGHSTNGHSTNGHSTNGHSTNGHSTNGEPTYRPPAVPIAVCGMACRLPGGLHTPQQLWEFLLAKGDARTKVPESRYNVDAYYDPSRKPGAVNTEYGYFLDVDLSKVDGQFFSFTRADLERQDPHQTQMMEVARECIEDAGETSWRGSKIGCYMGSFGEDWGEMFAKDSQQYGIYRVTGYGDFMLSNHVSYEMDLRGPSMTIRTGCSAGLIGLHEACRAIQNGDCTAAIVGGANLILAPGITTAMSEQGVLSPDGSCKTFSADANGYARGEAVSAVYLKPLDAALRDGNPVRAVIRGSATNSDGKTPGVTNPSSESHEAMMRHAYASVGITDFSQTTFVECHGTGTPTGDPIETNAVARVFGGFERPLYIGSVKPNLGHSEGASGLTSLIKTILALENRVIPPNIKFNEPNPKIPFSALNLTVPVDPTPWPKNGAERASVNSFGIGGANAHVILESARSHGIVSKEKRVTVADDSQLLLFTGNSPDSLTRMAESYQAYAAQNPQELEDLAYTLANGRSHLPYRAFSIAGKDRQTTVSATVKTELQPPKIIMIFTGQGAQWPQMGKELLESNAIFQSTIRSLDQHLRDTFGATAVWSIEEELLKAGKRSRVALAEYSQPLCTAIQVALIDVLSSLGIKPAAVVGHSSGEIAAAYAAGALTARDAIIIAWGRGVVTQKQQRAGSMAAVGMGWTATEPYLVDGVTVACENSPSSVTISGDTDKVEAVVARIKESPPNGQEVLARLLKVNKAYHSYHMAEIGDEYYAFLTEAKVTAGDPTNCAFYSSVSGRLLQVEEGDSLGPRYWQKNLESPVLFSTAVSKILKHPELGKQNCFLEIGPHSAMAGPLRQITAQASATVPYVSAMLRNENCADSYMTAVGKLWQLGVPFNLKTLVPRGSKTFLPDLPRYAWDHKDSYWFESRLSKEWRLRKHPYHDLLGVKVTESTDLEPVWRNIFHLDNAKWVRDHKIVEDIVFPFAGYVSIAGEAVRQVTGIEDGYAMRHVIVNTALVLTEGKPVEIMTTFRPYRLTDTLDSQWWEFTVASHNGQSWTKHCTGQVKALEGQAGSSKPIGQLPRPLESRKGYTIMQESGLNYGPHFQSLEDITAATTSPAAAATIFNNRHGDERNYHLHPVIIDAALQMLSIASTKGYVKRHGMVVPTNIEELKIYRCSEDVKISASAKFNKLGAILGEAKCVANGRAVLQMSGARLSPLPSEDASKKDGTDATARYEWAPHIDFLDEATLVVPFHDKARAAYMPVLDEIAALSIVYTMRRLHGAGPQAPHLKSYCDWVSRQFHMNYVSQATYQEMDDNAVFNKVMELVQTLTETPAAEVALGMLKLLSSITTVVSAQKSAVEILLADDTLTKVNTFLDDAFDVAPWIRQLAHTKPNLRILELGGDSGAATSNLLKDLIWPGNRVMFSNYTFTDPSSGVITAAKKRFEDVPNMQFATLDIGKSLEEQGFDESGYDLIIATNVLHATPSVAKSLKNARALLSPNGRLLLTELCPSSKWVNFLFGALPSWNNGTDGRTVEPCLGLDQWKSELSAAGLRVSAALPDSTSFSLNNLIVARPVGASAEEASSKDITLLCLDAAVTDADASVIRALEEVGYAVHRRTLSTEATPPGQPIIALLDASKPFFENIDEERYEAFKRLVAGAGGTGIFWVTKPCQLECSEPGYAQILGTARTIRSEKSIDFATCEVDNVVASADRIAQVFQTFQARTEDLDGGKPDFEYAIANGVVHVGRFYPFPIQSELVVVEDREKIVLETQKPGLLSALTWTRKAHRAPVGDQVEVEAYAAGLNFKDILGANGIVEIPEEGFGFEAAGIVTAIGPEVKDIKVGQRVMLFNRGSLSASIMVSELLCEPIPDDLSFDDAATMPCVCATAWHGLISISRLSKGQSVLIHSACGGVGIAAIQLAKMVGAEIFVTVGNEEKVKYLMETFGLPRNRIFNSRNASFVEGVMAETGGKGVDVALNSLSGELLHATWRCVAEFGTMLEIGKRDLLGAGKLDLSVFLEDRSYCCVDLDHIGEKRPAVCKGLLQSVVKSYSDGFLKPISPIKTFEADAVREAFRYMQQGLHMGKIIISLRDAQGNIKMDTNTVARNKAAPSLDPSGSYLLVGGLGGLGRAVSRWMVEQGARRLVYLSRSAGAYTPDQQSFIKEIESMGCEVRLIQGSVTSASDVRKAVAASPNLKGILQMSMVLRDQAWDRMSLQEWTEAADPKVKGTWNLHEATANINTLDFLVMFSSISGTIGQPGQANYAGANTFLDAFALYRASLGLPATSIDVGAVDDIGVISNNENLRRAMKSTGAYMIKEAELLEALGAAIKMAKPSPAAARPAAAMRTTVARNNFVLGLASTLPLNSPNNRSLWKTDARMTSYKNVNNSQGGGGDAASDGLKSFLATARHDAEVLQAAETADLLAREIGKKLASLVLRPESDMQLHVGLGDLGMDSLVAIEMRSWWKATFGFDISVLELLGMGSLQALGAHAATSLCAALESSS